MGAVVRMKQKRLEFGWNQVTVSYKADVPVSDLSKFENKRAVPYPAQHQRLSRVLQLDPAVLLDDVVVPADLEVKRVSGRSRKSPRGRQRITRKGMDLDVA